jgi:hypothetical protein
VVHQSRSTMTKEAEMNSNPARGMDHVGITVEDI